MFGLESANPCLRWLLRIVSSFLHLKLKFFNHPINLLEESRNDNSLPIKIMMMRTCLISLPGELGPEGSFLLCPFLFHSLSHAAFELFPEKDGSARFFFNSSVAIYLSLSSFALSVASSLALLLWRDFFISSISSFTLSTYRWCFFLKMQRNSKLYTSKATMSP